MLGSLQHSLGFLVLSGKILLLLGLGAHNLDCRYGKISLQLTIKRTTNFSPVGAANVKTPTTQNLE